MKKRYGKFFAVLLCNCSCNCIAFPVIAIVGSILLTKQGIDIDQFILPYAAATIFSIIMTILLTKHLNKHTPKEQRKAAWFRAWWLGMRIDIKISLFITIFLIPAAFKISAEISGDDVYFWEDGEKVCGSDGKEYTVTNFGGFLSDGLTNHKIYVSNGKPYFEDGLKVIWLKQR